MLRVDIQRVLEQAGIEVFTSGPRVSKGNINVHCPWCGREDEKGHMGINITTGYWGCLRNPQHCGRRLQRLLVVLIGCSWDAASSLIQEGLLLPDGFDHWLEGLHREQVLATEDEELIPLDMPQKFRVISEHGIRGRFFSYLVARGFRNNDIIPLCDQYDLRCCLTGRFRHRLVIPIYLNKELIAWTARAIGDAEIRYLSHPKGSAIKQTLFNYDSLLSGGRRLYITEGPFDAIKVDFYSKPYDVRATCIFGQAIGAKQVGQLMELTRRYDEIHILLDSDAMTTALHLQERISLLHPKVTWLPPKIKDPGDLSRRSIINMAV